MLIGSFDHSVDPKGRVFIPAKFRFELGEEFVLCSGIDKCILIFSTQQWMQFSQKLTSLPITNKLTQKFTKKLYASAMEAKPDKQGRVLIGSKLRSYAELEEQAVIIGMGTRAEIWSKKNWEDYEAGDEAEYEEALKVLSELGI